MRQPRRDGALVSDRQGLAGQAALDCAVTLFVSQRDAGDLTFIEFGLFALIARSVNNKLVAE
ncbi:hypothetical protein CBG25_05785 [Arsenophonus sp. ENCA]|uniref:hypothetical protein n=1 Tax=Arsenophonus sp. ENCA TaxID=1987579 RepID=UPI000BD5CE37|nr:hypothetical protein [Arsenophonus sp. ENCA]PAV06491.1 hypothetical protein CBG25_05785 [Arsenophonus sp. ENCA]